MEDEILELSSPTLHPYMMRRMAEFRVNGAYCDVTITVGDKKFKVHRLVLAGRSPYFDVIFSENVRDIQIDDTDPVVFNEFLDYVYTGNANVDQYAYGLLQLAERFLVQELKEMCETVLSAKANNSNTTVRYLQPPPQDDVDIVHIRRLRRKRQN